MPDWADCTLIVAGNTEDVKGFCKGLAPNDNGQYKLFDTYVPLPDIFNDIPYSIAYDDTPLTPKQEQSLKEFGFIKGSEFENQWWSVKWGDCDTKMGPISNHDNDKSHVTITTRFPWSEPFEGMIKLSKRFPKLKFNATYLYETNGDVDSTLYINGEHSTGTQSEMTVGYEDDDVFEDMMNFEE